MRPLRLKAVFTGVCSVHEAGGCLIYAAAVSPHSWAFNDACQSASPSAPLLLSNLSQLFWRSDHVTAACVHVPVSAWSREQLFPVSNVSGHFLVSMVTAARRRLVKFVQTHVAISIDLDDSGEGKTRGADGGEGRLSHWHGPKGRREELLHSHFFIFVLF